MNKTIYQFNVNNLYGEEVSLSKYKGKVLLIVNTASECGLTPQFKALQQVYDEYNHKGFTVLGFPSNNFLKQEPLNSQEIGAFCQKNYGVSFPMFEKINVKGDNTHELYQFLSNRKLNGKVKMKPKWNFHKYIIDKTGHVRDFYYPFTKPNSKKITNKIQELLAET